jgi:hypothetical protein
MTESVPKAKWFKSHLLVNGVILLVYFFVSCVIQLTRIQTNDVVDCLDLLVLWLLFYVASFFVMRKCYRKPFFRAAFAAFFLVGSYGLWDFLPADNHFWSTWGALKRNELVELNSYKSTNAKVMP